VTKGCWSKKREAVVSNSIEDAILWSWIENALMVSILVSENENWRASGFFKKI